MNSIRNALGAFVAALPEQDRQKLAVAQRPSVVANLRLIDELMDTLNYEDRHTAAMSLVGYLAADRDPDVIRAAIACAARSIQAAQS